jgi:acetyltransferase-like isoleucine patch superfamily enzyme
MLGLVRYLVRYLPETRLFALKRLLYNMAGAKLGCGVKICSSATIYGNGDLIVGERTWIGHQVFIVTGSRITIGSDVDIAPRVFIGTGTHILGKNNKAAGPGIQRDTSIGDGSWIGIGAIILPGVSLAEKTIVGAGAVVTRDTLVADVVLGNPARRREASTHYR